MNFLKKMEKTPTRMRRSRFITKRISRKPTVQIFLRLSKKKTYGPDFPKIVQKEYVYAHKENKK